MSVRNLDVKCVEFDFLGTRSRPEKLPALAKHFLDKALRKQCSLEDAFSFFWDQTFEPETWSEMIVFAVDVVLPASAIHGKTGEHIDCVLAILFALRTITEISRGLKGKKIPE